MSLRRSAVIVAALFALVVLGAAVIEFAGISVDAERLREPVVAALAAATGREVRIEGPARLRLSFRPELVLRDIRIANPPGFDAPDFARIAELRLEADLLPLFRNEVKARELRVRELSIRLTRSREGRGNWIFEPEERVRRFQFDWRRIVVEQGLIEYVDAAGTRNFRFDTFTIDEITGQSVRLALHGKLGQERSYSVEATSAPLRELAAEQPWPFDARVVLPGAEINFSGAKSAGEGPAVHLAFAARATDLRKLEALLDLKLPPTGTGEIAGELELSPDVLSFKSLKGQFGAATLAGNLNLDIGRSHPLLTGRLSISDLDLHWFSLNAGGAATAETLAEAYRNFAAAELDFKWLSLLDADIQLDIGHLAGVPGEVRELSAGLRIEAGKLAAPFALTFAGARFSGDLSADATAMPPHLRTRLVAKEAPLGGLAELLFDAPHVVGNVRRFEVMLDGRGNKLSELVRDLDGRVGIEGARFSYGNYAGGRPVAMRLDAATLRQPRGRSISGNLRGSLRDKPFNGNFQAGRVEQIVRERQTPFNFDGASGSVRARMKGSLAEPAADTGPDIAFDITAPRARELTPWLGFASASEIKVALKGRVRARQDHAALSDAIFLVGRTRISGDGTWQSVGGKALVKMNLLAERLAPIELGTLTGYTAPGRSTLVEIPILPESLDFADSDVELRVQQVVGWPLELSDILFRGQMRDGQIMPSPFSLRVEGSPLTGSFALDARGASPTSSLSLAGDDFDLGAVLRALRVAQDVDGRIAKLRFDAQIRGQRLDEILERSSFVARIESGTLAFRDANTHAALRIAIATGEVRADAGKPVRASIAGTTADMPIALELQTGRLREFAEPLARLPFSLSAQTPAAKLEIRGSAMPQRNPEAELSVKLTGERLDALDGLLGVSLPPWGPYTFAAQMRFVKRGYEVPASQLKLGSSVFTGRGVLDTARATPKLQVSLAAERIQLDDFPLGEWSPFAQRADSADRFSVQSARSALRSGARRTYALLSRELLQLGEADVEVAVKQIAAGKEELGRGRFNAAVVDGRATLGPIEFEGRAGRARGSVSYEPREHDVVLAVRAEIDRFDYGLVLRRFDPDTAVTGVFSVNMSLDATAAQLSGVLRTASGHIDFAVWPENLDFAVFDLWAMNLLRSLLPLVSTSGSLVNCVVGHFDLNEGQLRSESLLIDTLSTRVAGRADVDFAGEQVEMRFVPRHKSPRLFSLATPVEVRGSFDDYRLSLRPTDFLGTVWGWVTSLVRVPLSWFGVGRLPVDGHDVCVNPLR